MPVGKQGPPACTQCGVEIVLKVPPVQACVYQAGFGFRYFPFCSLEHMVEWAQGQAQCMKCRRVFPKSGKGTICQACLEGKTAVEAQVIPGTSKPSLATRPASVITMKVVEQVEHEGPVLGECGCCGHLFYEPATECPECFEPVAVGEAALGGS